MLLVCSKNKERIYKRTSVFEKYKKTKYKMCVWNAGLYPATALLEKLVKLENSLGFSRKYHTRVHR